MILQDSQLVILNTMRVEQYAEWLLDGCKDWPNPAYRHNAFVPIHYALSLSDVPLYEQLAELYGQLSTDGRRAFSLGLAQAICDCSRRPEWTDTVWQLFYLGVSIRAREVIEPIMLLMRTHYLVRSQDAEILNTFSRIINALSRWNGEPALIPYWQELLRHPALPPDDASLLFIALCRAKPKEFPEYLRLAAPHFVKLHQHSYFPRYMIKEFVAVVPLEVVAQNLCRLRLSHGSSVSLEYFDDWFFKEIASIVLLPYCIYNRYKLCPFFGVAQEKIQLKCGGSLSSISNEQLLKGNHDDPSG